MKKIIYLFLFAVCVSACTVTYDKYHLVVTETEQGTSCTLEYPEEVHYNKAEMATITPSKERFAFSNDIFVFHTGNREVLEEVVYTLTRAEGDGICNMYIINESECKERDSTFQQLFYIYPPQDIPLTDEQMEWVKQNATAACTIGPKETSDEVVVKL